jgi:hypothetical protein
MDHIVDTIPNRTEETMFKGGAAFIRSFRENTKSAGITLFDLRDRRQGIVHVVSPEQGIALPVPVRQWVLSFPIPLRSLFAVHPELLAPILQIIHRAIATFLIDQIGIQRDQATTGAVTLIQRFGSAANLNIHLHALVLDGIYGNLDAADIAGRADHPRAWRAR